MRRMSVKIALPLLLGMSSLIAVACGEENPPPSDEGGNGNDIGDGGGEPNDAGGTPNDGSGGGNTDGSGGGGGSGGTDGEGGEGGETGSGGGSGGTPPIIIPEVDLPECTDEPDGEIDGGVLDGDPCWGTGVTCKGTDTEQFLQQCSGTCIEHFDNDTRIVGFDGTLPPL